MSSAPYILHYVCKYCGQACGTFPAVRSTEPATLSVCDRRECREQASRDWKAAR